tara:strand:+ start:1531 stop:2871 length:1341 start_codon:yes stop_codon:yes gene_type:complete
MSILLTAKQGHVLHQSDYAGEFVAETVLTRIKDDLHAGQRDFVDDTETEILGLCAGYGSGKTVSLCAKTVQLAILNMGHVGCVLEPTNVLIRDIFINDFNQFLEKYGISYSYRASPLPEYILHLGLDTKILCRSFENYQRIVGLNLAFCIADEVDTVSPAICDKAFPRILGRLRDGNVRQFAAASTPEGFRFFYNTFGTEEAKERKDRRLIKMKTTDNPHLPPDFISRMEANYDPALLKSYLLGEFVNINTGTVYDRFDRDKHVTSAMPDLSHQIIRAGIDFNIGNTNCILACIENRELFVFDEMTVHDTDKLGQELRRRFPHETIYGYPDASGGNRSTNASRTDIQILSTYNVLNQSGASNPAVKDRINSVQALLENGKGEIRLHIHPRCKKLIECLELQSYTEKGDPDKETNLDHLNDCLGYLCWREFNPLQMGAGRGTGIRLY